MGVKPRGVLASYQQRPRHRNLTCRARNVQLATPMTCHIVAQGAVHTVQATRALGQHPRAKGKTSTKLHRGVVGASRVDEVQRAPRAKEYAPTRRVAGGGRVGAHDTSHHFHLHGVEGLQEGRGRNGMEKNTPPPLPPQVLFSKETRDRETTASDTWTMEPRLSNSTATPPPDPPA